MDKMQDWLFNSFIQKNPEGEYFFNTVQFSKLAGEPIDPDKADKGENAILHNFLVQQIESL